VNVIGILKDFDSGITCAKALTELTAAPMAENAYNASFISYLKQGVPVIKLLTSDDDADGTPIGQRKYLTDGEWIWPSYYVYYLEKYPNIIVPKIFLDHVNAKKNVSAISYEDRLYAEYMALILLKVRIPKGLESLKKIQHLIQSRGEEIVCY
jgi:hypothetical protein